VLVRPEDEVLKRKWQIEGAGLAWSVVESIAIAEDIKTRTMSFQGRIYNYKRPVRAVARAGVKTICYDFVAITDWARTDLMCRLPTGGYALRFDHTDIAVYDLLVLHRPGLARCGA
jgi:mannonate dehydratase